MHIFHVLGALFWFKNAVFNLHSPCSHDQSWILQNLGVFLQNLPRTPFRQELLCSLDISQQVHEQMVLAGERARLHYRTVLWLE